MYNGTNVAQVALGRLSIAPLLTGTNVLQLALGAKTPVLSYDLSRRLFPFPDHGVGEP